MSLETEYGGLGSYYLEPYLTNAGLESVACDGQLRSSPTTSFPTTLLTQAYVPILPKHIWSEYTIEQIQNSEADGYFKNDPPVVGTGPYQAVEWEPGEFIRFVRNPNYWGEQGAADEVIIQNFEDASTMVQALKTGEIDYVRGVGADQFDALANEDRTSRPSRGSRTATPISRSTPRATARATAVRPRRCSDRGVPRRARLRASTRDRSSRRRSPGTASPGDTNIPPYHVDWHVPPTTPRTFDIEEAARRLDAAGYKLDADGKRLDKDGKPINLRLTWPDSEDEYATNAQFIQEWFGELGINVDAAVTEEGKLLDDLLGPSGRRGRLGLLHVGLGR